MSSRGLDATLLPGAGRLLALHGAELPQKDELCGAFWATLALRAAGFNVVDQDEAAIAADTVVSNAAAESLPPGETGRHDFRHVFATTDDPAVSGTSTEGVIRAVERLSAGGLCALPVMATWTADTIHALFRIVESMSSVTVVANVGTRFLWGGRPRPTQLIGYLEHGVDEGPDPDWDVGHFVGLVGAIRSAAGTLIVIADTYASLGVDGVHLQPIERVAAALNREGMAPGGALVIVPTPEATAVGGRLRAAGLTIRIWNNGTHEPARA